MCYVIITGRSLIWLLLSLVSFMLILTGIMTPKWLMGQPLVVTEDNVTRFFIPSVGIYNRCIRMSDGQNHCGSFSFYGLHTDSTVYPAPWKAAMFFLSLCAAIQFATVLGGVLACCVQAVFKKSVVSLAGATQALGGVFGVIGLVLYPWGWGAARVRRLCGENSQPYIPGDCSIVIRVIGLVLYPWGWGAARVRRLCGENSQPYIPGDCSIGWAMFVTSTGVGLIFLASALSKTADKAANSDKVQFQIDEGKQLICLA